MRKMITFDEANGIARRYIKGAALPALAIATDEVEESKLEFLSKEKFFIFHQFVTSGVFNTDPASYIFPKRNVARCLRSSKVKSAFNKYGYSIFSLMYSPNCLVMVPSPKVNALISLEIIANEQFNSVKFNKYISFSPIYHLIESKEFYENIFSGDQNFSDIVSSKKTTSSNETPTENIPIKEEVKEPFVDIELEHLPEIEYCGETYYFPKIAAEVLDCVNNNENFYIYGPHGCGKTMLARILFKMKGVEPLEVDFSAGVDEASFLGTPTVSIDEKGNKVTKFQYGIFPRAIIEDRPLIINEIDFAKSQYLAALHGIMEADDPKLVLMDNDCEVLRPKKGGNFCIGVTANTIGNGDDLADYHGTSPLNAAFLDRFDSYFQMGYTDQEIKIVKKILENDSVAENVMNFITDLRRLKESGKISNGISTRRLKMLCVKIKRIGLKKAFTNVLVTRLDDDDRQQVVEVLQRFFPQYFK